MRALNFNLKDVLWRIWNQIRGVSRVVVGQSLTEDAEREPAIDARLDAVREMPVLLGAEGRGTDVAIRGPGRWARLGSPPMHHLAVSKKMILNNASYIFKLFWDKQK